MEKISNKDQILNLLTKFLYKNKVIPNENISDQSNLSQKQINEQLRLFFHSIRGSLNSTSMGINILEDKIDKNNSEVLEILNNIKLSCNFTCDTLDKYSGLKPLLDFSKKISIEKYPFNINGFFNQIKFIMEMNCINKNIKYNYNLANEFKPWVIGDEHNLMHVIISILDNCINATKDKLSISLNIINDISSTKTIQNITIIISDENIPRNNFINNVWWITNKEIILLHDGTLEHLHSDIILERKSSFIVNYLRTSFSYSKPNKESSTVFNKFIIKIPLKICNQINSSLNSSRTRPSLLKSVDIPKLNIIKETNKFNDNSIGLSNKCNDILPSIDSLKLNSIKLSKIQDVIDLKEFFICVIDDSDISRKLLIQLINITTKIYNIKTYIHEAKDGLDGILKFYNKVSKISIIFLDNIMPTITGPVTARLLRALGYKNLIIGITGNSLSDDVNEFNKSGIDYLFTKPFKKEQMNSLWDLIEKNGLKSKDNCRLVYKNNILFWDATSSDKFNI
jgi:CheY-like chemotaxis protein